MSACCSTARSRWRLGEAPACGTRTTGPSMLRFSTRPVARARYVRAAAASSRDKPRRGAASSSSSGSGDADNLSQMYGPARTALPRGMPADRQADAMTALNAIEAATSWRQLPAIFSLVTKLPQNHAHLLAMTQALTTLATVIEAQYVSAASAATTPGAAADAMAAVDREVEELQRFARELTRATRLPLDYAYTPRDVATLLRCFCSLGAPPPDSWLVASEAALLTGLQRISDDAQALRLTVPAARPPGPSAGGRESAAASKLSEAEEEEEEAALAVLSAAASYRLCGHVPRPELVRVLPPCASTAWSSPEAKLRQYSSAGDRAGAGATADAATAVTADAVMLPSGEEVALGGMAAEAGPDGSSAISGASSVRGAEAQREDGDDDVVADRPLPAECLGTLAHALMAWDMPTDERWLRGYVQAVYYGLCETVVRAQGGGGTDAGGAQYSMGLEAMPQVLWALIMQGICPDQPWLEEYLQASLTLLQQQEELLAADADADADAGPGSSTAATATTEQCCSLVGALSALGGAPGSVPDAPWLDAVLACAARCTEPVAPDVLGQLLFDVGAFDQPLTPDGRRCVVLLAQQAQILMAEEERRGGVRGGGGGGVSSSAAQRQQQQQRQEEEQGAGSWSAKGLALLLMGLVRCGVRPSELRQGWLGTWSRRALALSPDFSPDEVAAVLNAAEAAGEQLPSELVVSILGTQLLVQADAAAASDRDGSRAPTLGGAATHGQGQVEALSPEQLCELLSAVLPQRSCRLPAAWLQPLRRIGDAKLSDLQAQLSQAVAGGLAGQGAGGEAQGEESGGDEAARITEASQQLCLALMQVSGMLDQTDARQQRQQLVEWLGELTQRLALLGGLRQPGAVAEAAVALSAHGSLAAPLMQQVEEASLACGSEPTPDAYRQLLSAFARTSHSPSSQWWEQLRSCLEVATAPVTHTQPLQDSLSRDAELSGVLTAVCAFRSTVPGSQAPAQPVCDLLRNWACQRIATLSSSSSSTSTPQEEQDVQTAAALGVLLPALMTLPEGLPHSTCVQLCALTQQLPGLGGLELARSCLDTFNASGFAAPADWLSLATQDVHEQLLRQQQLQSPGGVELSPGDILRLLTALALSQQQGGQQQQQQEQGQEQGQGQEQAQSSTTQLEKGLPTLLVGEAGQCADGFTHTQLLQLLQATAILCSRGTLQPGSPGMAQLIASTAEATQPFETANQLVAALGAASISATYAEAEELEQLAECLLQPVLPAGPADRGAPGVASLQQQQQQQQEVLLDVLCRDASVIASVLSGLSRHQAQLPEAVLQRLLHHLPRRAADQPTSAAAVLLSLATSQQQWPVEEHLQGLAETARQLLGAVVGGGAPVQQHSTILSALAATSQRSVRDENGQLPWLPAAQLTAVVEAAGRDMPQYQGSDLCTVIAALAALGATLPATWLERFFDYAVPSQCATALLPGAAMAVCAACSVEQDDEQDGPPLPDPVPWLRRMEAAVAAAPEALTCRDAALLFAACARQGYRLSTALVQELLELALTRAQHEHEQQQQQLQGPGPEAAGAVGLLVAANTSLGYTPSQSWADRAWDALMPVIGRVKDPRLRQALDMALAQARAGIELA